MLPVTSQPSHAGKSVVLSVLRSERRQLRQFAVLLRHLNVRVAHRVSDLRTVQAHAEKFLVQGHLPTVEMGLLLFLRNHAFAPDHALDSLTAAISQVEARLAQFSAAVELDQLTGAQTVARPLRVLSESLLSLALKEEQLIAQFLMPVMNPAVESALGRHCTVERSRRNSSAARFSLLEMASI